MKILISLINLINNLNIPIEQWICIFNKNKNNCLKVTPINLIISKPIVIE
jgi:hypothetical protein